MEDRAKTAAANVARAIYETGRERNIAAWENYQAILQQYEDARLKHDAAYKAERTTRRVVRDAAGEVIRAARKAVERANTATRKSEQYRWVRKVGPEREVLAPEEM